jgi:hypothetical protein
MAVSARLAPIPTPGGRADGHRTSAGKPWHQVAVKRLLDRP